MERTTVKKEGFAGIWHKADKEFDSKKALIVIGGSEGNENIPLNVGRMFAEKGISALGMMYFNAEGLPDNLIRVPLEPFGKAIEWLKEKGYERIYIYGISKGGELSLLVASLFNEINGVIAVSPMHCLWTGLIGNKGLLDKKVSDISEFTYKGEDFKCMKMSMTYGRAIRNLIFEQQFNLSYMYEKPLENFDEDTAIKVENIKGDILFIYPGKDQMWPSPLSVKYMKERLQKNNWKYEVRELCYEKASHILVPLNPDALKMFKVERKYPEECKESRMDAFNKSVEWLKER